MFYWFAFWILWLLSKIFSPITVCGKNKIPSGNIIIASNHVSNLDPVLLGLAYGRRISYLAKDTLFSNKIFSWVLYHVSAFPIKRNTADISALRMALKRLSKGDSMVVFPEGTRKANEPQQGIGFLAVKSGVPVVPAYIDGSDKVLPAGTEWPKRGPIKIIFGEPVIFSAENKDYAMISAEIMQRINALNPA
jgi:1-acyl-sn-glycerol-3-phosphate acyltransferase